MRTKVVRTIAKIIMVASGACAFGGAALAASPAKVHMVRVAMPDGTIRQIRYQGDTPPRIVFIPVRRVAVVDPVLFDPFRLMDRMATDMDRQFALTQRRAAMAAAERTASGRRVPVTISSTTRMPAGNVRYSFVSSSNGRTTCSRMIQITSTGSDRPAKVVSRTEGDCDTQASQPSARTMARPRSEHPVPPVKAEKPRRPVQPPVDFRKTI
jgi:hypothetical protein